MMQENVRQPCARENCPRYTWNGKDFCSGICHFLTTQLENSEQAATKYPNEAYTIRWYETAVLADKIVTELSDFKRQHSHNLGKRRNDYAKSAS